MNANDYRLRAYSAAAADSPKSSSAKESPAGARDFFEENKLDTAVNAIKNGGLLKVPRGQPSAVGAEVGKESVHRRVAKFLLLIGSDEAAEVLKFLPQEDVEKIIPQLATIRSVDPIEAEEIFAEFRDLVETKREGGGENTALNILEKAFGPGKAQELMGRVEKQIEVEHPFTCLKEKTAEEILKILKGESGQVISIVLSHLEPKKAAAVINIMDAEQKKDTVLRLAKMQKIAPEVITAIDKTIRQKASAQPKDDSISIDGKGALLQILKKMDLGAEREILDGIERFDPALREDLQTNLFTIEDIINCDDRYLQEKLREMSDKDIAYLIADKNDAFQKKIFSNVSTGRGDVILEEEAAAKPMLKKDVDAITKAFLESLRTAYQNGSLRIIGRDDEEYVN